MPLPIGAEFAGYRIDAVAGRGGMGVVYRAHQPGLGRDVALKVIAPEHAGDSAFRARFIRESRLTATLEHPNVVPVFEAGEHDGTLFIAMRWVAGRHLGELLAEGPLAPEDALTIAAQLAAALDAAHRRGLVHRDVKPGNVLLSDDGDPRHVYLADFGLARSEDSTQITTGSLLGTPAFAAPEQIEGRPVDARTDVYALACVAYAMLAGRAPFGGRKPMELLWAHVHEPPPRLEDGAKTLEPGRAARAGDVIERGLAKQPQERQQTAGDFARELTGALGGEAGSASTPTRRLVGEQETTEELGGSAGSRRPAGANRGAPAPRLRERAPSKAGRSIRTARLPRAGSARRRMGVAMAAFAAAGGIAIALILLLGDGDEPVRAGPVTPTVPLPAAPDPAGGTVRCEDGGCRQAGERTAAPVEDASCVRSGRPGSWTRIDSDGGTPLLACIADEPPATSPVTPPPVPDLTGARLDLAERLLERDGVPSEARGGGTFGIVQRDNWTVCATVPPAGEPLAADERVELFVERSC